VILVITLSTDGHGAGTPRRGVESPLQMLLRSRLWTAMKGIFLLLFFGSVGYLVLGRLHAAGILAPRIESPWGLLDCVYMTVITVSTIGYGEIMELTHLPIVRIYTIVLILTAMILVAYSVSSATAFFVSGDLQRLLQRRRAMKKIARFHKHFIVCGCDVTGRVILDELISTGHPVVVIDDDHARLEEYSHTKGVVTVDGDATNDEVLLDAGIERAAGLAAALPGDKDNLFLIISVRQLNPKLRIVSLASEVAVQNKLMRAGADAVVSSSFIGGLRLASELLRPAVVSFLDLMLRKKDSPVRFAEVEVGAEWAGRTLGNVRIQERTGLPVLALKKFGAEEFLFNPAPDLRLETGMALVTMGEVDRVKELDRLVGDPDGPTFLGGESGPAVDAEPAEESAAEAPGSDTGSEAVVEETP
jgi:voltage-gated potassium channel